jgi:hypothetical protein
MKKKCEKCGALFPFRERQRFCSRRCSAHIISAARSKKPILVLAHGIKVIGEYTGGLYVVWRIRPHRFFSGEISNNGVTVRRCRVIMAAHLGRGLGRLEFVHHKDGNKHHDELSNFELMSAADHNREHKIGSRHTESSKEQIGRSVAAAYRSGQKRLPKIVRRDEKGRIVASA